MLGANDGIVSTTALVLGVIAAGASSDSIVVAGVAALVAGAMSMATGEYVSVSSQADTESAALDKERGELRDDYVSEERELTGIYVRRGLSPALAAQVARDLMAHDAIGAHARDELGLSTTTAARPLQAALASAASFAIGAVLPLLVVTFAPLPFRTSTVVVAAMASLAALGGLAAWAGGARPWRGIARVSFWSALAMTVTYGVGSRLAA